MASRKYQIPLITVAPDILVPGVVSPAVTTFRAPTKRGNQVVANSIENFNGKPSFKVFAGPDTFVLGDTVFDFNRLFFGNLIVRGRLEVRGDIRHCGDLIVEEGAVVDIEMGSVVQVGC